MWTKSFWTQAAERAVKAFAWAMLAALSVPNVGGAVGVDVLHIGWQDALSLSLGAALLDALGSLASGPVGPGDTPSLVRTVPGPSDEAVRILSSPESGRALADVVRDVVRRHGPGGLR